MQKIVQTKKEKAIILVKHLQAVTEYSAEKEEVESYFSEQEDPMMKQCSHWKTHLIIQKTMSFNLFFINNRCP